MGTNMFIRDLHGEFNIGLRTVCRFGTERSWPEIPHSCHRCTETARPSARRPTAVEWHSADERGNLPRTLWRGRARLVVLAAEMGGRWSQEASIFLRDLAKARAQAAPLILQGRVQAAHLRRWSSLLTCSLARAFALCAGETVCARRRRGRSFVGRCSGRWQVSVFSKKYTVNSARVVPVAAIWFVFFAFGGARERELRCQVQRLAR